MTFVKTIIKISQEYLTLENIQFNQIDRRLKTSLKRLNYITDNSSISIPYEQLNKEIVFS